MDDLGFEKDIVLPSYNSQAQNPPTVIIFNVMHLSYVSFKLFSLLLISLVFLIWFPGCVFSWLCLFRKGFQCLWLFLYIFEVCIRELFRLCDCWELNGWWLVSLYEGNGKESRKKFSSFCGSEEIERLIICFVTLVILICLVLTWNTGYFARFKRFDFH